MRIGDKIRELRKSKNLWDVIEEQPGEQILGGLDAANRRILLNEAHTDLFEQSERGPPAFHRGRPRSVGQSSYLTRPTFNRPRIADLTWHPPFGTIPAWFNACSRPVLSVR